MVRALERRGPDAEGMHSWPRTAFGHRRLSIFDLSEAGRQPMLSDDAQTGVVFNGAIYNFRALRATLESEGCQFRSGADTEVLIHGYRVWGIDGLLERLRGMFAAALWDETAQKAYLFRDRLGVKPLVYRHRRGELAFASTARALRLGGFVTDIEPQAMLEYLEFGYVTDVHSIYVGARKVPPGHVLEWSDGQIRQRAYWRPPAADNSLTITFPEAVEETERLFLDAVKIRLDADVPVGSLLSGGVDSSLVCWAVAKLGADIQAFTVGTPGDAADETQDAVATAKQLGIRHEVIDLSGQQEPDIGDLVSAYGEPFCCSSALGMLKVCQAVKRSATVLLTGDGGDDVFLGYPEHQSLYRSEQTAAKIPRPVASGWNRVQGIVPRAGLIKRGVNFLNYATGGLGAVIAAHDGLPRYRSADVLGDRLAGLELHQRLIPFSTVSGRRVLGDFLRYDHQGRFVAEYLTKVDGAAMHWAIEARSPFLDQELWNFAGRLPYGIRLWGSRLKAVLRELARKHLGERVAFGAKRGFTIPAERWLLTRWRTQFEEILADSRLAADGWIAIEPLTRWWNQSVKAGRTPQQFWRLFVLEHWLRAEPPATTATGNLLL
jgi:asparagine synthase (glutamine-hydrolysing)